MKTPIRPSPDLPHVLQMAVLQRPLAAVVRPPGSKSVTNRALVCAALAKGDSLLEGALDSEDTQLMAAALRRLGVAIEERQDGTVLAVVGCNGQIPAKRAELFVGNSGTTMRFLTALCATSQGRYRLDGVPRMRERPIGDLIHSLRALGADATCEGPGERPPVTLRAHGLQGGQTTIAGSVSSQFLSGLLMAAPFCQQPLRIDVSGELVSLPYIAMTLAVMRSFGADAKATDDYRTIDVGVRPYEGRRYVIEPDASAASYFFAAAAATRGKATVLGLGKNSLQGDVAFCEALVRMGCRVRLEDDRVTVEGGALHGIDIDMNAISDTVQTLAVLALFANGPTRIRHVAHIRHKETDRIAALACELRKLGAKVTEFDDGLEIWPSALHGAAIDTYDDHRMAMSFAIAGLRIEGVVIRDPGCTRKTYPWFFRDLEQACAPGSEA